MPWPAMNREIGSLALMPMSRVPETFKIIRQKRLARMRHPPNQGLTQVCRVGGQDS